MEQSNVQRSGQQLVMFLNVQTRHINSCTGRNINVMLSPEGIWRFLIALRYVLRQHLQADVADRCCCHSLIYALIDWYCSHIPIRCPSLVKATFSFSLYL